MELGIVGLIAVALLAGGAITAVALAYQRALDAEGHRRTAEVRAAALEADLRVERANVESFKRQVQRETARADALEEELSDADKAVLDHPDAGARRRMLTRWRVANERAAVPAGGGGSGPVPDAAPALDAGRVGRDD